MTVMFFIFLTQGLSHNDDTENRYSSQYEERLDPFSSFSKKVLYVLICMTLKPACIKLVFVRLVYCLIFILSILNVIFSISIFYLDHKV